ncbi:hypothetical protein BC477_10685 [Clavibacter michiganensis subsp. michiganensis]|uniref:Uncharacterized protein n=1 Tax=Clavibacter michiganensis subsp. michiganensis TaxID=33013 RepID=A0A251XNW6_CLAMM|nr:hypothetical protein BC477_10685 [Clavibacter michiganensis subsp. michiganensis]OUE05192.1 hypothetical protein CMMCAS07_09605 [Clavibacter michiganensis subsp. michiganensis]
MGAVETGIDLGLTGPVPLAPATLLRLPAADAPSSSAASSEGILTDLLAGTTVRPSSPARAPGSTPPSPGA